MSDPRPMTAKTLDEQCDTLAKLDSRGVWACEGVPHCIVHYYGFACPVPHADLVEFATELLNHELDRRAGTLGAGNDAD